ncbi:MAG: NAD(P)/FAD-dependent oxidoreductase [Bryobacteraceae bacterium]|nr:NAD(P)/FAD-dependent oxidoreductase [Bryobacteraceae bacterium]
MQNQHTECAVPHVVIVGGGFGGLAVARSLRRAPVRITLIDRTNHHLFQPLLYQVATAVLTPGQIAAPIRQVLGRQENAAVIMGEVTGVDTAHREVIVRTHDREDHRIAFDYLVLATGVQHSYFGRDDFAKFAPGLKTMADATDVRNKVLQAFETAEVETNEKHRDELLTFVLVGGGPTGVEMAGAIAELANLTMRRDFRRIDPGRARIVLVEAGPRVLSAFDESLSLKTQERLRRKGVELRLGQPVEHIDEEGVIVGGERIFSRTVIWTAGVTPSPAAEWLGAQADRLGRVRVNGDLSVGRMANVFVIGDVAYYEQNGRPVPGVAPVAIQQGKYVGRVIAARAARGPVALPVFRYNDKGAMAVVGRNYAVMQFRGWKLAGYLAWLVWSGVHVLFLALPNLRISVFLQWIWSYLSKQRGSRLIVVPHKAAAAEPVAAYHAAETQARR